MVQGAISETGCIGDANAAWFGADAAAFWAKYNQTTRRFTVFPEHSSLC